jgi:uncharacterized protein YceH (UPF0502 family)
MLDRTEQRIVGVLIEKERTVPDIYPLSENALVDGCNQKNNRDPVLELQSFQVAGALMSLQEKGWAARVDGVSRVTKWKHRVVERLGLTDAEVAIFAELLLRGPQAPGALKPRIARLGFVGEPAQIESVLQKLAGRPQPLVEQLPLRPRERDRRWRHLVGDGSEREAEAAAAEPAASGSRAPSALPERRALPAQPAQPAQSAQPERREPLPDDALAARVARLEREVAELKTRFAQFGG